MSYERANSNINSGRLSAKLKRHIWFRLAGRCDNYDPNTDASNDGNTFLMAGLDYRPAKNVSVIPNFQYVSYQAKDAQGNSTKDLVARITFAYSF